MKQGEQEEEIEEEIDIVLINKPVIDIEYLFQSELDKNVIIFNNNNIIILFEFQCNTFP